MDSIGNEAGAINRAILPLVDLRPYDDFEKQNLSFSSMAQTAAANKKERSEIEHSHVPIVNLPLSTLLSGERSCELPPRHVEFAIVVPHQLVQLFYKGDDCSIHELFFASQSKSTLQSRKPWLVRQVLIDGDSLWNEARAIGLVRCFDGGNNGRGDQKPFRSIPRLWKPDPLISSNILPMLKGWIRGSIGISNVHNAGDRSVGSVIDLGSGAGRDICYLAEECKEFQHSLLQQPHEKKCAKSIHFIGIDNHKGSARRCIPLWRNHGVDDITDAILLDLNKLRLVRDYFISRLQSTQGTQHPGNLCIFAVRFLNRKLLSYIANSHTTASEAMPTIAKAPPAKSLKSAIHLPPLPLVLPLGTVVAVSHFCKPEGGDWNFDHPKESSVLDRWELKNSFGAVFASANDDSKHRWQIVMDDLIFDGDHGRTMVQFVARKVA